MAYDIQVDVQHLSEETAVINLQGDVTIFAHEPIYKAYNEVCGDGIDNIIMNFAEHNTIYSPGLAIIVDVIIQARKKNQNLLMALPNSHSRKLFSLVGLKPYVNVFESLEDATSQIAFA